MAASGGDVDCATVEFGCVEVGADEPINLGAAQVISGADAIARSGPGERDRARARLPGRHVRSDGRHAARPPGRSSRSRTSCAPRKAGRRRAPPSPPTRRSWQWSGRAVRAPRSGVADTILGDKGITLISGSNTSPALTDPELHNPFYARTAHNDRIQGAIGAEFALDERARRDDGGDDRRREPLHPGTRRRVRGELRGRGRHHHGIGAGRFGGHRLQAGPHARSRSKIRTSCTSRSSWRPAR